MLYRVMVNCPQGRFRIGEVGRRLPNDYPEKYDVKLDLGDEVGVVLGQTMLCNRIYYFYREELEPVPALDAWDQLRRADMADNRPLYGSPA